MRSHPTCGSTIRCAAERSSTASAVRVCRRRLRQRCCPCSRCFAACAPSASPAPSVRAYCCSYRRATPLSHRHTTLAVPLCCCASRSFSSTFPTRRAVSIGTSPCARSPRQSRPLRFPGTTLQALRGARALLSCRPGSTRTTSPGTCPGSRRRWHSATRRSRVAFPSRQRRALRR